MDEILYPRHPVIAQLVEHLTVESRSNQMVPGSIPGDRIFAETDVSVAGAELSMERAGRAKQRETEMGWRV